MMGILSAFGFLGILSILVWIAALVLSAGMIKHPRRLYFSCIALPLALLALLLAKITSGYVSDIQPDRTEELRKARELQQQMIREGEQPNSVVASRMQFAEDSNLPSAEVSSPYAEFTSQEPAYRAGGKKARSGEKPTEVEEFESGSGRTLPAKELAVANRLDVWNLTAARFSVFACLLFIPFYYLRPFNRLSEPRFPLPFAGRFVDWLSPKASTQRLSNSGPGEVRNLMLKALHKGETFLWFNDGDPKIPDDQFRLQWKNVRIFPIPRLPEPTSAESLEFVFESLWFGRGYAILPEPSRWPDVASRLRYLLEYRARHRARCRRSFWIVLPASRFSSDWLADMETLAKATNCRLLVVAEPVAETPSRLQSAPASN